MTMKSIIPDILSQCSSNISQEKVEKQQKEYHLIGQQRKVRGHTLFEFNRKTKEIRPADISHNVIIGMDGQPRFQERIDIHKDCFYIQALNVKNAKKKLIKLGYKI